MKKVEDLTGRKFNNVTVISLSDKKDSRNYHLWNCICDCGKEMLVRTYNIKNTVKSCGCQSNRKGKLSSLNQKRATYKRDCLKKGLEFNLTDNEFREVIQMDCYYCGSEPKEWSPYIDKNGEIYERYIDKMDNEYMLSTKVRINGIDRLNSNEGYSKNNCVPCCKQCNLMKNSYTEHDFLEQIKKIYNFKIK